MRIEPLEHRLCCASVVVDMIAYDTDGFAIQPDCPVAVGDEFVVEISVQDFHPWTSGLAAVSIDVQWTPAAEVIDYVISDFCTGIAADALDQQPLTRGLDNASGTIDDLSAISLNTCGNIIGNLQPEVAFTLHVQAIDIGLLEFTMEEGRSGIVPAPTATFQPGQIQFVPLSLEIVA